MTSKQKRKLLKSLSHDVTSITSQKAQSNCSSMGGSSSNVSEDQAATGGKDVRMVVKREEFICSDNHQAHLEEDYLEDESRLFGRQLPSPGSGGSHRNLKVSSPDGSRNSSSSRRTLRKLFKSKSMDAHSVKSNATSANLNAERDEVERRFAATSAAAAAAAQTNVESPSNNGRHRMLNEDREVDAPASPNNLPMKPPRKRSQSFLANQSSPVDGRRKKSVDLQAEMEVPGRIEPEDDVTRVGKVRPRLVRRDSAVRPLECDPRPKLYSRQSITHARQFSQESAIDDSVQVDVDGGGGGGMTIDSRRGVNGDAVSMYCPERPRRRRHSQLVKRDSVIHPVRPPPRQSQAVTLGTSSLYQPLIVNGRFQNPWSTWKKPSFVGSLRWTFATKDNSSVPNSAEELDKTLPVLPLRLEVVSQPPLNGMRVTWLGHASVLIQFDSISVLTDPMFSDRASPLGFFGPKRIRPFPGSVYDLPKLDAVVISHNHYDHLDYNSVLLLNARFGADLHWFVPVGLRTWMHNAGCETVTELTWWAECSLPHVNDISFCFTPAQHWSKRTPTDDNKVLWGSWCILGPRYRFFFAGDTGYCDVFKQIGAQFGPFDLAAIPIGAYEPRWFMHNQHIDPSEAVKIHQDLKADKSLGIHWGTFILTNEHYLEPPLKLAECARHAGLLKDDFFILKHGESRLLDGP